MNFAKTPSGTAEIGRSLAMEAEENIRPLPRGITAFRRASQTDGEAAPESLNGLLRKASETSAHEIDNLIDELQTLRGRLQNDSDRIQRDITKYAALSEQVMQITKIISDSVKKLPDTSSITG
jgi:ABC-type transporter Mla subunit MlaD